MLEEYEDKEFLDYDDVFSLISKFNRKIACIDDDGVKFNKHLTWDFFNDKLSCENYIRVTYVEYNHDFTPHLPFSLYSYITENITKEKNFIYIIDSVIQCNLNGIYKKMLSKNILFPFDDLKKYIIKYQGRGED